MTKPLHIIVIVPLPTSKTVQEFCWLLCWQRKRKMCYYSHFLTSSFTPNSILTLSPMSWKGAQYLIPEYCSDSRRDFIDWWRAEPRIVKTGKDTDATGAWKFSEFAKISSSYRRVSSRVFRVLVYFARSFLTVEQRNGIRYTQIIFARGVVDWTDCARIFKSHDICR